MQLLPTALLTFPAGLALLLLTLFVAIGLPLVAISHLLQHQVEAPVWRNMANETANGGGNGKLVGGSKGPPRGACQQCGTAEPAHRCAGCSSVAYCSRQCQQKHWTLGHKHECKKLRKQWQQAEKLGAAAGAGGSAAPKWNGAVGGKGSRTEGPDESNSSLPVPKKVLYPSERYAELASAPPQRKQPSGLQNVGNSCYANSLLQSLLATPSLAAYLVSGEHSRGCLKKPSANSWCVVCELEKLACQTYSGDSCQGVLNPRPLLRNVKRLGKQFSFGRQEDSHELYLRLIEAVETVQLLEAGGKARYDLRTRETTLIHHVFAGYTRNQIECRACGHVSCTYECCCSLTLEVSPHIYSLEAALRSFTAAECLDGDNRYKCDGCKAYVAADKSTQLEVAPHVLQICLKRFGPGRFGKITSRLSFPEQLDLGPYMAVGCLDNEAAQYSLYAIVVHIDWGRSTDYGHYISYVKSGGSWFQCDDATVTPVAAAKALAAGAYLLFYEREAPHCVVATAGAESPTAAAGGLAAAARMAEAAAEVASAAAQPSGGMLRVEMALPSLPYLATNDRAPQSGVSCAAGSHNSSPRIFVASNADQVVADQEGDIGMGLPEAVHACASDSDLLVAQLRSAAAAPSVIGMPGTAAGQPGQHAEQQCVADQRQQAGMEGIMPERGLEETAEAAATAAREEVEALLREQAGGSSAATAISSGSSRSSSTNFGASANPFDLLGPEDSERVGSSEAGSESEDKSSGHSEGRREAQRVAAKAESLAAGRRRQQQQQQPAAASRGSTTADVDADKQQAVAAAEPAVTVGQAAAGQQNEAQRPAGGKKRFGTKAQQHPAAGSKLQASAALTSSADAAAEQPPAATWTEEQLPVSEFPRQLPASQSTVHMQAAEMQSSSSARSSSSIDDSKAAPCTPKHRASVTEHSSGQAVLRLSVELPGVQEEAQVEWWLATVGTGTAQQELLLRTKQHALRLPLPVPVAADAGTAKWAAARQKLVVSWPVLQP